MACKKNVKAKCQQHDRTHLRTKLTDDSLSTSSSVADVAVDVVSVAVLESEKLTFVARHDHDPRHRPPCVAVVAAAVQLE
jgi:hypothetical protein